MERMMSREEVAGMLGISPSYVGELVKDGSFPNPISLGKSSRTDRWPVSVVQQWLAEHERIIYGKKAPAGASEETKESKEASFVTGRDIAVFLGSSAPKVFAALVAKGLLQEGTDEFTRYRPTEEGFKSGYFWRIEKYSIRDEKLYYQTVFTARGKDEIIDIVRAAIKSGRQR